MSKGPIIPTKPNLPIERGKVKNTMFHEAKSIDHQIKGKWDEKIKNLNIFRDRFVSSSDGKNALKIPRDDNFIHTPQPILMDSSFISSALTNIIQKTNNIEEIKKISKDFVENLIKAFGNDET